MNCENLFHPVNRKPVFLKLSLRRATSEARPSVKMQKKSSAQIKTESKGISNIGRRGGRLLRGVDSRRGEWGDLRRSGGVR